MERLWAMTSQPNAPVHTPDEFIRYMNDPRYGYPGGYFADVTNEYPGLNPYVVRAIRMSPVNGHPYKGNLMAWANDYGACVELRNRLANAPHPSPLR
jgi:hypothetical protein